MLLGSCSTNPKTDGSKNDNDGSTDSDSGGM